MMALGDYKAGLELLLGESKNPGPEYEPQPVGSVLDGHPKAGSQFAEPSHLPLAPKGTLAGR